MTRTKASLLRSGLAVTSVRSNLTCGHKPIVQGHCSPLSLFPGDRDYYKVV